MIVAFHFYSRSNKITNNISIKRIYSSNPMQVSLLHVVQYLHEIRTVLHGNYLSLEESDLQQIKVVRTQKQPQNLNKGNS